jgi:hypothetical protein
MKTITQVGEAMQRILGPVSDQAAIDTNFTQRKSKVTGSVFMQAMVFSTLEDPEWRYTNLVAGAVNVGVNVSKQGLAQRFTESSAKLAQRVLESAVTTVIQTETTALPLLERFKGTYIRDSSIIHLPQALKTVWQGGSSSHGSSAGIKLHTRLEVSQGQLAGPVLAPASEHDQSSPFQTEDLPVGAVRMGDLGFFDLDQFALDDQKGIFWLSRYKARVRLYTLQGQPIDLLPWLRQQTADQFECPVLVGQKYQLACRLIVERVPAEVVEKRKRKLKEYGRKKQTPVGAELLALTEWTLILTNIPIALLSIPEALVLLRVRWQIELLFKRWKSLFKIDEWRSTHIWRILTELYAKLLSVVIEQWILLTGLCLSSRPSFWNAALVVRKFATALALALPDLSQLELVLDCIAHQFHVHCRLGSRRSHPSLYQLLERSTRIVLA